MTRVILGILGFLTLLSGPLPGAAFAQAAPVSEDRRAQMERDLKHRQTMLSQQEARVREAENNVMQARQAYDQLVGKQANANASGKQTGPGQASGLKPAAGGDTTSQAYKALDSANYQLNVLRADERNLRESVKVLREALGR